MLQEENRLCDEPPIQTALTMANFAVCDRDFLVATSSCEAVKKQISAEEEGWNSDYCGHWYA